MRVSDFRPSSQLPRSLTADIVALVPTALEIWLYGSRARGTHRPDSDTDILVLVPDAITGGAFLDIQLALAELSNKYSGYDIQGSHSWSQVYREAQREGHIIWSSFMRIDEITQGPRPDYSVPYRPDISGGQSQHPRPRPPRPVRIPTLGDIATIKTRFPDADFWIQRVGDKKTVGRVKREYNPSYLGVKITDTEHWRPDFIRYYMEYKFMSGYYENLGQGLGPRVNIRRRDVADIELPTKKSK